MKDLFLTPRGDLAITETVNQRSRLEINFLVTYSNALCIDFYIEDTYSNELPKNSLCINFNTKHLEYNKELRTITGNDALVQAIKIRIMSALGSIKGNENIGSRIEEVIHEFIDTPNLHNNLVKIIQEAISDIVPSSEVSINKLTSKYLDYSNCLEITIKEKDQIIKINI